MKRLCLCIAGIFIQISAQDIQVKMVTDSYMDIPIPVIGKVKVSIIKTTYLAKNLRKTIDSFAGDGFFFRWIVGMVSNTTGEIVDINSRRAWKYNTDDQEYWTIPFIEEDSDDESGEDENQNDNNRSISYSFSFSNDNDVDEEEDLTSVTRSGGDKIENIHGFRVRKWTTTVSRGNDRIVIDEWAIKALPLLRLADSLNREIELARGTPDSLLNLLRFGSGFSNNETLLGVPGLGSLIEVSGINSISGEVIKGDVSFFEDGKSKAGFGSEVVEIYAETFDSSFYTIPEEYERIENE